MLSLINKKLIALLSPSASKAVGTKVFAANYSYATRAPEGDQNMASDPKEYLKDQKTKHTQSKPGSKATKKNALRSEGDVQAEFDVQDRQEGNMIHDTGTEERTPSETYNVGRQTIGQQVGGVYKDRLDFASSKPQGTASPVHDQTVDDLSGVDRPHTGTIEKLNEDVMNNRSGYGEHVEPMGNKTPRHKTTHKHAAVPDEMPFVSSFHTWSRLWAPNTEQVPKKNQSPPQATWRPEKGEDNINDDNDQLIVNYLGEDHSRENDDRLLDSTPHRPHSGVLGVDKDDAERSANLGKPLKGQYERN